VSRKIRVAKRQVLDLPSPSWTFELLVGASPGVRLRGWVKTLQAGEFGEPTAAQVWETHGDALTAEAEAHGFVPHYLCKRRPTGHTFTACEGVPG
jgi:hypothetical protein